MKSPKLCQLSEKIGEIVSSDRKEFLGRVLTVIDSSIADPQQRKAAKDLVNDAFYNARGYFGDEISRNFRWYAEATGTEYYQTPPTNAVASDTAYNPYKG